MTVEMNAEALESRVNRLRAAQAAETDPAQQAVLSHETALLNEARGDEAAAIREQLSAFSLCPEFREPVEALLRMARRNPADENLPKMLETLVEVATTPEQSARALWELAAYRQGVQQDLVAAMDCLTSAVEIDPKSASNWLELELLAARSGDAHTQMRALEARSEFTANATWQGLLLVELATICAEVGEVERATSLLDTVVGGEGGARYLSRLALETIAAKTKDHELQAHALEGQAELVAQAIDDPSFGDAAGVPQIMRKPEVAAMAWLRAAELRRVAGDSWGAVAALSGAAERLPGNPLLARLRMAAAEASGDEAAALEIAREQLGAGATGRWAAALWLRVGQASEAQGQQAAAVEAYGKALELDPESAPALALYIDRLAAQPDGEKLARVIEGSVDSFATPETRARVQLCAALVWASRASNVSEAQRALARAQELGVAAANAARIARSLASVCKDSSWYEQATESLVHATSSPAERNNLWLEIGRSRLRRGELEGALEAFGLMGLGTDESEPDAGSAWLGRCLAAYAVGLNAGSGGGARNVTAIRQLGEAEPDEAFGRGLATVAALLAARSGQIAQALELLTAEHLVEPGNVVVGVFCADLHRREGNGRQAAEVLVAVAAECNSPELAAALYLEAGFLRWAEKLNREAIAAFELALEHAPLAGRQALGWALRCVDPDDVAARGRALDLADESGGDPAPTALERWGLSLAAPGDDERPNVVLELLDELAPTGDLGVAGALARVLWGGLGSSADAMDRALLQLEELGGPTKALVRAERYRMIRFEQRDGVRALSAAQAWSAEDPSAAAALEWLGAALAADDRVAEAAARVALSRLLQGSAAAAVEASAALVTLVDQPLGTQPFLSMETVWGRLTNIELARPGSDPARRAAALRAAGAVLGGSAAERAAELAAWSDLARDENAHAQAAFKQLVDAHPENLSAWEGYRDASERLGDHLSVGLACARLGSLCQDDARAAAFWEAAGLTLLEHTKAHEDAEIALARALERDPNRPVAFDKLFRRVRSRNEDDRLLELIDGRLSVTQDVPEMTKMYWERARVLRRKGDQDGALKALNDVTLLEPDHVGALALAGEIHITRAQFAEAAPLLARLAGLAGAPDQQRLVSGVAAADLYEKKLGKPEKGLEVLLGLHNGKLSTLPVRERLARIAAKVGAWRDATAILEQLMEERDNAEGRAEAARLAMAIYRDKLEEPEQAERAVGRLLREIPDDAEALRLVLGGRLPKALRGKAVTTATRTLIERLTSKPFDAERLELLAEIAAAEGKHDLHRAALGCLLALGHDDDDARGKLAELAARAAEVPQMVLDDADVHQIVDPDESGALGDLFRELGPTVAEALGPSLDSENVGRKQRIDVPGDPLRADVARWMAALGFGADFQLFVGGRDEKGIRGIPGEVPALIVGTGVRAPLDVASRTRVACEVFALRRGRTVVLRYDDPTVASIAIAACIEAGLKVAEPPFTIFPDVARSIHKHISRKVRKNIVELCQRMLSEGQDAQVWAAAARRSIDRMALVASGDASVVIDNIVGPPDSPARRAIQSNERARRLLAFALSSTFLGLRSKFGMGIA